MEGPSWGVNLNETTSASCLKAKDDGNDVWEEK